MKKEIKILKNKVRFYLKKSIFFLDFFRMLKGIIRSIRRLVMLKADDSKGYLVDIKSYKNVFIGYYDKNPFNQINEDLMLVHANNAPSYRRPNPNEPTDILLINWKSNTIIKKIGTTYSWNWQQGARAHWFNDKCVIFNYYDNSTNQYKARLYWVSDDSLIDLPIPVQESHHLGFVFSLSYEALNLYRPDYGYRNHISNEDKVTNNSIIMYDINNNEEFEIVNIFELEKISKLTTVNEKITRCKINHIMASPGCIRIVFLFRYYIGKKRVTDLFSYDLHTKKISLLLRDKDISHYFWKNDNELIYTGKGDNGFGYYIINLNNSKTRPYFEFGDGHPHRMSEDEIVIDTYPDKYGQRKLCYVQGVENPKIEEIGSFTEPFIYYGETRCDLHPSVSFSRKFIQIDIIKSYNKKIFVIES